VAKSKGKSEVEELKGLVRSLQKEVKRTKKRQHLYEDLEIKQAEEMIKEEIEEKQTLKDERCPKCQGNLEIIDGARIKVFFCSDCDYRKSKRV